MALPAQIEAGVVDLTLFSQIADKVTYRIEDSGLPPMFRPTLVLTTKPNRAGTNVNVTIKLLRPITAVINGNLSALNTRVTALSYTSLQNTTDSTAGADLDIMIAAITALKSQVTEGRAS